MSSIINHTAREITMQIEQEIVSTKRVECPYSYEMELVAVVAKHVLLELNRERERHDRLNEILLKKLES